MDNVGEVHVLDEEIQLRDLLGGGAVFSFESDYQAQSPQEYYENDFFNAASNDKPEEGFIEHGAPGKENFKELARKMKDVTEDGFVKKLIIKPGYGEKIEEGALVEIHYNAFWEGENASFDSSYLRGQTKKFTIGEGDVLPGLELATKSMVQGENAKFLISYQLLFGERGCVPRIKPRANGLFNIEVIRVIAGHKITELDKEEQAQVPFEKILTCAKSLHVSGKEAVNKSNLGLAIKFFLKGVRILEMARMSCEEEQDEQQKLLLLLYTNLAVCYNKLENPRKACTMCNEISRITDINTHCKALYQNALAVQKLGNFQRASVLFNKALKLNPGNPEIGKKLVELETKIETQAKLEKEMYAKMLDLQVTTPEKENETVEVPQVFQDEIRKIIEDFSRNNAKQIFLPPLLFPDEIEFIEHVLQTSGYNMVLQQSADKYYIKKTEM